MNNLIVIGTLHQNLTPEDELIEIIKSNNPVRILIEMTQRDLDNKKLKDYPPEMIAVYNWAEENNVDIRGFDVSIKVSARKAKKSDFEELSKQQQAIISNHDWKEFNKRDFGKMLETELWYKLINNENWNKREIKMAENIVHNMDITGINIVITGSGHIPFFQRYFPNAKFPLAE